MPESRRTAVAVVGPGEAPAPVAEAAYEVGRALALAGHVVVTGGGAGVMAAASRGAKDAGGTTVALLPGTDPGEANRWADIVLPTGLGEGRDLLVVRAAAVVVAIGGSWGTLAEVALARRAGIPVVGIGTWVPHDDAGEAAPGGPLAAADPAAAVRLVTEILGRGPHLIGRRADPAQRSI
ncbi:MAG: TIGR00725 family protein [Frankiaceae bacterium]